MLEEYHIHTCNTVVGTVALITACLEALKQMWAYTPLPLSQVVAFNHKALVCELHAMLMAHIVAMCSEPADYELLTEQLSQAVKCHILQLINLALGKQEMAGLIMERLIPVLLTIYPPASSPIIIPAFIAQVTASKSVSLGLRS